MVRDCLYNGGSHNIGCFGSVILARCESFAPYAVWRVTAAILILWTVNRMARTRMKVYREGLVIVRVQHLGTEEVFVPYESIQGLQAVFLKLLYFRLAIAKSETVMKRFLAPALAECASYSSLFLSPTSLWVEYHWMKRQ